MGEMKDDDDCAELSAADYYFHQGEIKGAQEFLLIFGGAKFECLDDGVEAAVKSITDLDRLKQMVDGVLGAKDWQELFGTANCEACDAATVVPSSAASN
jgi:hypothetical protein